MFSDCGCSYAGPMPLCWPSASGFDLEHHPAVASWIAAVRRCSVEISSHVSDQTSVGACSVHSSGEAVQHGQLASLRQLEHPPVPTTACTIEVSRVPDQTSIRACPVRFPSEAMEHGQLASLCQLEHRSAAIRRSTVEIAALCTRAIEIALRVPEQTCVWIGPVRSPSESIQRSLLPGFSHLEHRTAAIISTLVAGEIAAIVGRAVDI